MPVVSGINHTVYCFRSPQFSALCVRVFDRQSVNTMKFDDFIQCCVMLKTLTDAFRKYDTQQRGVININYEQVRKIVTNPAGIYYFQTILVHLLLQWKHQSNCKICSKLTIKTLERRNSVVFFVNFEQISLIALMFP